MSGSNIFGELAIAFKRTIGSPIRKPEDDSSLDKSKSQSKGAVHKIKQILPHHVWSNKDKNESLVLNENASTDCLRIKQDMTQLMGREDTSITASDLLNENTDNESDKRKLDNYIPSLRTSDALLGQIYREELLTCSVTRKNVIQERKEKVRKCTFYFNLLLICI